MTTPEDPNQPPPEGTQQPPVPPDYTPPPPAPPYGAPPAYGAPQYGQPQYGAPQFGGPPPQYPGSGYPPSGYGGVPYGGAELAPWIYRVGGYLIDAIIVAIPSVIILVATGSRVAYDIVAILLGLVIGYLNGATGQSPGKRVIGIKVVREQDGQLIGGGMGIVRLICHFLDSLACLIGWFWPLWDSKKQTFADKIMSTIVIKV
jgi:uncharacterized RDD family membrane protein YckC